MAEGQKKEINDSRENTPYFYKLSQGLAWETN